MNGYVDLGFSVVLLSIMISVTQAVNFTDCGSTVRDLEVSVKGCAQEMEECPFIVNENATLYAKFISGDDFLLESCMKY